jgi:predicted nucleotidyltransferase component of viral defense system
MQATRREILKLAAVTRFEAASLEKVLRLNALLAATAGQEKLRSALVLKGGTALNLFFGAPGRLSVDLDLNYVGHLDRSEMLGERPLVEAHLERVAMAGGYALQRSANAHAGRTFHLSYRRTAGGQQDRIAIDVNFLHRQCLLEPEIRRIWQPDAATGRRAEFPVLSFDELAAGKLIALLDRAAPRDAWDLARLASISAGSWPGSLSKPIFVAMAGALPHPLHSYSTGGLSRITDRHVERLLHPLLLQGERPSGDEVRSHAREILGPLLDLSPTEREDCDRLQRGELAPELLFPDDRKLASRIASSPPLVWKALNARNQIEERR